MNAKKVPEALRGRKVHVFFRADNEKAASWAKRLTAWLRRRGAKPVGADASPEIVLALGGDGTILEAARAWGLRGALIVGLNLGTVGFLASVREPRHFLKGLARLALGRHRRVEHQAVSATVTRDGEVVFSATALNEVTVQHLLGVVDVAVSIDGHPAQRVRGNGVMVATATGSTAYNLSAHGPIVAPDIRCLIVTELLDHNVPTPSVVVSPSREIELRVVDFREHRLLAGRDGESRIDVLLSADGDQIFSLRPGDVVRVTGAPELAAFAELEPHYFLTSLHEKFTFR